MSRPGAASPLGRYFVLSTAQVAPRDQRDFWRDTALNRSEPDFPSAASSGSFQARVRGVAAAGGELREGLSDAVIMRRTASCCRRDGSDEIMLSFIVEADRPGQYRRGDSVLEVPAGAVMINDSAVPFIMAMGRYRSVNLRLPRAAVAAVLRRDPAMLGGRLLSPSPFNTLLFGFLTQFAGAMAAMDDAARQAALTAAIDLALASLHREVSDGMLGEGEHADGLRQAARRYIDGNLHRQDLSPDHIARTLRCSRTHLYRLFAQDGGTVMGYLREARLARSHAMLADAACRLTIGEIALLCGFDDPSTFSRGFRRRYGCQPGDVRREARVMTPGMAG